MNVKFGNGPRFNGIKCPFFIHKQFSIPLTDIEKLDIEKIKDYLKKDYKSVDFCGTRFGFNNQEDEALFYLKYSPWNLWVPENLSMPKNNDSGIEISEELYID